MVNELRTLLLNRPALPADYVSVIGEEFVSKTFRPIQLPAELNIVWSILFGVRPDRVGLNRRIYEILKAIHSTDLEEYVYRLDPRVTYLPFRPHFFVKKKFPTIKTTATAGNNIFIYGDFQQAPGLDVAYFQWSVSVIDSNSVRVTTTTIDGNFTTNDLINYTVTNGLSNKIGLPGSLLQFAFSAQPGSSWIVEALLPSSRRLVDIIDDLDKALNISLFINGSRHSQDVLDTCYEIWETSEIETKRLAAVAVALAYRIRDTQRY